jgi:cell division septation protein DedD
MTNQIKNLSFLALTAALLFGLGACATVTEYTGIEFGDRDRDAVDYNLSKAHMARADFFYQHGDMNRSIQEMEWAVAADHSNFDAAYNLGLMYLDQGRRSSARRVWETALRDMQDDSHSGYEQAMAHANVRAALAELDRVDRPPLASAESILVSQGVITSDNALSASTTPGYRPGTGGYPAGPVGRISAAGGGAQIGFESAASQRGLMSSGARAGVALPGGAPPRVDAPAADMGVASRPGLAGVSAPAFTPKPYVPSSEDGQSAARSDKASAASAGSDVSAAASPDCPPCQTSGKYAVLISSNRSQNTAQNDLKRLRDQGYQASIAVSKTRSGAWHTVWAGCCTSETQARELAASLVKQGFPRDIRVSIPPQ